MDNKILNKIIKERNEMVKNGYNPKKIFIKLNENIFKRNKFILDGTSVIYSNNITNLYKFIYFN